MGHKMLIQCQRFGGTTLFDSRPKLIPARVMQNLQNESSVTVGTSQHRPELLYNCCIKLVHGLPASCTKMGVQSYNKGPPYIVAGTHILNMVLWYHQTAKMVTLCCQTTHIILYGTTRLWCGPIWYHQTVVWSYMVSLDCGVVLYGTTRLWGGPL